MRGEDFLTMTCVRGMVTCVTSWATKPGRGIDECASPQPPIAISRHALQAAVPILADDIPKIAIGSVQSAFGDWVSSLANSRPLGGNGRSIAEINENWVV